MFKEFLDYLMDYKKYSVHDYKFLNYNFYLISEIDALYRRY